MEDEFIPRMLEICRANDVRVVVPTIDTELATFAEHVDDFAEIGTRVLVPDRSLVAVANDKGRTHEFMMQNGIACLRQTGARVIPADIDDWRHPLIAKPSRGSASIGVHELSCPRDIMTLPDGYIVQEHAPGDEYTMDVFLDEKGSVRSVVPRRRVETRAGEVSKGLTVHNERLEGVVKEFCSLLPGGRGVLTVQAFFDKSSDEINIIEVNARFGGGYPLSYEAGADFPLWIVQESLGQRPDFDGSSWTSGLAMLRYDEAVYTMAGSVGLDELS